ncbi:MAG: PD40 domain-containing protein [Acidobacteria bacterium]|nr:PD40 domain-containing protein [Acidobacteriota bacterium]
MKFHIFVLSVIIIALGSFIEAAAQVDTVIGQVTNSTTNSFATSISGDGRFVVFESTGNLATENPRNTDGNREIFLFDYAQRRIYQITDTKPLKKDATLTFSFDNIKVDIVNERPVISNDGKWIAFSSNATCAYPGNGTIPPIVSTTNPGNFDANAAAASNPCVTGTGTNQVNNLVNDGNTEIWLYQVPTAPDVADLSAGDEIAPTDLSAGTFTRVTNTLPSRLPVEATTSFPAIIADDNTDTSIDDTGSAISFTSNRDLVTGGNVSPSADNNEIFAYFRAPATIRQITTTPRGTIGNPIYNINSTIANIATGWRILFMSNANNPVTGMTGTGNSDNNEELFYTDLDSSGALTAVKKQITATTRVNAGDVVNLLYPGRRMSRDGRYIAFDSYADLGSTSPGANQAGFATFLYDTTLASPVFRQILPRSNADSAAAGGDLGRYVGFTDYDAVLGPKTLVLQSRMNFKPDGTIPSTSSDGLNDDAARPTQLFSYPLDVSSTAATFKRLGKLPTPSFFLASTQPMPSNTLKRMAFNFSQGEIGTGNADLNSEVYYMVKPDVESTSAASLNYSTGASRIPVSASPVPTPTATPTPSPTPTPTVTPSPTPTPTPQQPPAVQGVSPGMLAIMDYNSGINQPVVARTAVGSVDRSFMLPIELSGVTMTVNGAACGLKTVGQRQIVFVVPPGLNSSDAGTVYPVVINNNGVVFKGSITVMPARPDIFTKLLTPGPNGRTLIFNATNRVLTNEPFTITTFKLRGSRRVPSVLRVYVTGINNLTTANFIVRIGSIEISGANFVAGPTLYQPGVYTVDFTLPATLAGAGDQPIVFKAIVNGVTYQSRLDDTASRLFIL